MQITNICVPYQEEQIQTYHPSTALALKHFTLLIRDRKIIKKSRMKIVDLMHLKKEYGELKGGLL